MPHRGRRADPPHQALEMGVHEPRHQAGAGQEKYEIYLPQEIEAADCQIIKFIPLFKPLESFKTETEKIGFLRTLFHQVYDKHHPVRTVLFKLDSIAEIAIVEGKSK